MRAPEPVPDLLGADAAVMLVAGGKPAAPTAEDAVAGHADRYLAEIHRRVVAAGADVVERGEQPVPAQPAAAAGAGVQPLVVVDRVAREDVEPRDRVRTDDEVERQRDVERVGRGDVERPAASTVRPDVVDRDYDELERRHRLELHREGLAVGDAGACSGEQCPCTSGGCSKISTVNSTVP